MKTIKGPAVFLAQFVDKSAPFNSLDGMCKWASGLGYKGIQIPTWESSLIDLEKYLFAAASTPYDRLPKKIVLRYKEKISSLLAELSSSKAR